MITIAAFGRLFFFQEDEMPQTLKMVTLFFCALFGLVWAVISIKTSQMYVPPVPVQVFLVGLLSGKYADSYMGQRRQLGKEEVAP